MSNIQPVKTDGSSTLPEQKHSYNTSISSNVTPQYFKRHPSTSSGGGFNMRLSRTTTNNTDSYANAIVNDAPQSLRTIDKIQGAKPAITYADKLWTQIDVLDDVRNMAEEVKNKGSFFNDKFNQELSKLKISQNKLLETMSTQQFSDLNTNEHQKQLYHLSAMSKGTSDQQQQEEASPNASHSEENLEIEKKKKEEKINAFFQDDDLDHKNQTIYNKQNFEEINQYVAEVKKDLGQLGAAMKEFDESTKEIW
ncbi:uncharacterized protein J8A68_000639 [[Candida] subhashii]|uniref:Uncharacterized protein n=1 Tax=[Candida] subhashii TaxID=561895 RepID=A0A8J5QRK2_9ASCO|nr:uncharacterized protein J8A68_000639 [[Candida] subhashii]KAG7665814.1 hypothetical protein J8A68_000639 [[Candida] subhashii]